MSGACAAFCGYHHALAGGVLSHVQRDGTLLRECAHIGYRDVPVGLIFSAVGGTYSEAWTSESTLAADPNIRPFYERWKADVNAYIFRSNMVPFTNCLFDVRNPKLDYRLLRRLTAQWQSIAPYYTGDFWPLTPYSTETSAWMAWQFDRPDLGEGCVQVFRRADSVYEAARLKLRGLDPEAKYEVRDLDEPKAKTMSGRDLMTPGLLVNVKDQPGALVITYRRVAGAR